MAAFQGLGAKFDGPGSQGFHSSISGTSSSPFIQPSGASSQTSVSLDSNGCLLPATTHDTIKSNHHMKDLEQFVGDLQLSAKRAFPNSGYSRYKEVEVLLIRWEEDELEVEWELNELQQVFREEYGFSTEQFLIPIQNAHRKLNHKALSFVEDHEREDMLLIVYYGGHGAINKARQSTWSCKTDKTYATVEWSAIQTLFEMARCDVLLLLDCCAGASAAPLTERPTNIKETIAACGFETWAPRPGPQSFTKTLIEVLKEWASQLPFSAAMLHSEILTRLKHQQPHRSSQGGWVESRKTPAYIVSTPDPHTASITLGRLVDSTPCSSNSSQAAAGTSPETLSEKVQGDGPVSSEDRLEALLAMDTKGERKAPHVLLTIALEEDQVYDAASCARWLKQFPLLAKYVSVEGVYRSYSTLLLLSVPVVLWDLLPDHPAAQFVGYVRSQNLSPPNVVQEPVGRPMLIFERFIGSEMENDTSDGGHPHESVSGLSSIDSGYGSCSRLAGPTSSSTSLRNDLRMANLRGNWKNPMCNHNTPVALRRKKSTSLLGSTESSPILRHSTPSRKDRAPKGQGTKRLIVMLDQADLDDDKSGLTCVLWYGNAVKRSQPVKRASSNPVWDEEFRFEIEESPMFYHLGISVWGGQMSELIGDLYIDLRCLASKGQLPELNKWQSLRCDGQTTGVIRFDLQYLDASEDEERKAEASNASGKSQEQLRQRQERQQLNDGQNRIDDFHVW